MYPWHEDVLQTVELKKISHLQSVKPTVFRKRTLLFFLLQQG